MIRSGILEWGRMKHGKKKKYTHTHTHIYPQESYAEPCHFWTSFRNEA